MKLTANIKDPPISSLIVATLAQDVKEIKIVWDNATFLTYPNGSQVFCMRDINILRAIAKAVPSLNLYGKTALERTQIDHWLTLSMTVRENIVQIVDYLNKSIAHVTFLVSNQLTIADLAIFGQIYLCYDSLSSKKLPYHIQRWYNLIYWNHCTQLVLQCLPDEAKLSITKKNRKNGNTAAKDKDKERKQEGKFEELFGAEMGKVVVRFPPEASGYLHIGHAKAALLNQYYAEKYQGKLIMRFDDTNPSKESEEFEKVILEDLKLLEIEPDVFSHTSNYFDLMLKYCEQLINENKAYVDDTNPVQMKSEREQKIVSKNRNNDLTTNMSMWKEMLNGSEFGQKCCVRAKIDMSSLNGCMRDPTIYRCKNEPHPKTGTKYKVYPTYDFACPIVDAIENVTHTLRTMEYHDRDEQFYWFIDALKLRKPHIWEYSRLNMTNTVLSKRKLSWFVESYLVDGWNDPRFPSVRGIIRRGMTVQGLKEFIIAQGSSKSVVFMNWDKIWAFNKKVIDPIAPRYTALEYNNRIIVNVSGVQRHTIEAAIHPKNESLGVKLVNIGPKIYIDAVDAEMLKENENATFINWGNLIINTIHRDSKGNILKIDACPNLDNKDFKKTVKLTWLAVEDDEDTYPLTYCVYFDHIISKPVLAKDEDFKQYVGHNTRVEVRMLGDPELKKCKKGDIIQLQRRGFFKVDNAYAPPSPYSNVSSPIILFSIPDGHTKNMPSTDLRNNKVISERLIKQNVTSLDTVVYDVKQKQTILTLPNNGETTIDIKTLNEFILKQGNVIRNLKSKNAPKTELEPHIKLLVNLKAQYKDTCGQDWKAMKSSFSDNKITAINAQDSKEFQLKTDNTNNGVIESNLKDECPPIIKQEKNPTNPSSSITSELLKKINIQNHKVLQLKTNKVDQSIIDSETKLLLALKIDFKSHTGQEWKPEIITEEVCDLTIDNNNNNNNINELISKIKAQGDKIRSLKNDKASKSIIDPQIQILLKLKAEYKSFTGSEWSPDVNKSTLNPAQLTKSNKELLTTSLSEKELLKKEINQQGEKVRAAKLNKTKSKEDVDAEIAKLLALKAKFKEVTGTDFPVADRSIASNNKKNAEKKEQQKIARKEHLSSNLAEISNGNIVKKQTRLGLEATKEENLSEWYSQVITKGELIEYYDVSGCYILRHWSYAIWKFIKNWFDVEISKMGVKECYFPIFVSKASLEKEKTHIADFAPEVAWVTKSGDSDLAEPIAIRPTSETVMYPTFAKWIQSYRDLPIRLNQWNNVVRWEFKHPQPFLRTREFLWQEGHTAFANKIEADKEVLDILHLYGKIYTDLLAIPVIKGRKTEKEKFAGGDYTTTVEAFISSSGRAIQGATSHHLGQNFSKMFEIVYEDPETQKKQYVYQNSWGITTRTIGVMIMIHADNQGIVLPPHVACIQAIIVPCGITSGTKDIERETLLNTCQQLEKKLNEKGVRCEGDYRENYSPGWKFNHWELKGVPIRIELGPKDMKANQIVAVRRDTGEKLILAMEDVEIKLTQLLETIHDSMLAKAREDLVRHTKITKNWLEFCQYLEQKNILLAPFCGDIKCEDRIKTDSARDDNAEPGAPSMGAKSLCIPFEQPALISIVDKCIHPGCLNKPQYYTLFGRSY